MSRVETRKPDPGIVNRICEKTGCGRIVATILANREIVTEADLDRFFDVSLKRMSSPFGLKDMDRAVDRLYQAVVHHEKILCFVDYDADGVSCGTVLLEGLRAFGADVHYYIPNRETEGYGLSAAHITNVVVPNRFDLVVTADCGSKSADAIIAARNQGIDVIVTDHHEIALEEIPEDVPVVNPKRPDDASGLDYLAGVGVAFYLIVSLRACLRKRGFFQDGRTEPNLKALTEIVAIGTVADVVPLKGDNRILVNAGLDEIRKGTSRSGLAALLKIAKIDPQAITSIDIAFKLAPRINAASRMSNADIALQLLTCTDPEEAKELAAELDLLNNERKEIVQGAIEDAETYLEAHPEELNRKTLVICHRRWPAGIVGIVAGRLAEKYSRPVVVIAIHGDRGKGSARSVPGFDIHAAFSAIADTLDNFGGHDQAGGIAISVDKIDAFKLALERYAAPILQDLPVEPVISVDYEIGFEEINEGLMTEIERLEPFGAENPEPVFLAKNVRASGAQVLCGAHRKMFLEQPVSSTDRTFSAIHFNIDDPDASLPDNFGQVVFKLGWNHWNNRKVLQVQLLHAA